MDKIETANKIYVAAKKAFEAAVEIRNIGKDSEHVYQARMDQFADKLIDVFAEMNNIIDDLDPWVDDEDVPTDEEIYAEVCEAIKTDRQYAAESVMHWRNKGHNLGDIAGWLETSTDVLVDLVDEFMEA